jgi:hypothetical protein
MKGELGYWVAALNRYIGSYLYGLLILMWYVILDKPIFYVHYEILFSVGTLLLTSNSLSPIQMLIEKNQNMHYYAIERSGINVQYDDRFWFVYMDGDSIGLQSQNFNYYVMPGTSNLNQSLMRNKSEELLSPDEFGRRLAEGGYNYLYLQNITDDFAEQYGQMFENAADISNGRLYNVLVNDDRVSFHFLSD